MLIGLLIVICYLIGSISFSYLAGRKLKGIDIRQHGSGNAGATNTMRVLGKIPAISVFILDILKGIAAVWIGRWLFPELLWVAAACGLAAVIGHNWPVFFGFKGGKGIATTIGVMAMLSFLPFVLAAIIAFITIFITRYVSLGSLIFTALLPVFIWWLDRPMIILWASLFFAVFASYRHRSNIVKLLKGTEHKLGMKK